MMRSMLVLLSLLITAPAFAQHPDQSAIVAQAKSELQQKGVPLDGPCGAFQITALAAPRAGAGVLSKVTSNNCQGFAVDILMYPDGHIYDVLSDAGDLNGPVWQDDGIVDPSLYRAAPVVTVPGPPPPPVGPPPTSVDPSVVVATINARALELATQLAALSRDEASAHATDAAKFQDLQESIRPWKDLGLFLLKYVVPEVMAILTTYKLVKQGA